MNTIIVHVNFFRLQWRAKTIFFKAIEVILNTLLILKQYYTLVVFYTFMMVSKTLFLTNKMNKKTLLSFTKMLLITTH